MCSTKEKPAVEVEKDLSILTERQRTAYSLWVQRRNYSQVGREMEITPEAVRQLIKGAERRFREYKEYNDAQLENNVAVDFALTRGDLKLALQGLRLLEAELEKGLPKGLSNDWKGRLPYKYQRITALSKRIQLALYGKLTYEYEGDE